VATNKEAVAKASKLSLLHIQAEAMIRGGVLQKGLSQHQPGLISLAVARPEHV